MVAVAEKLQDNTIECYIERTVICVSDIPASTQCTVISNIQIEQLPKVVYIGFAANSDFMDKQKQIRSSSSTVDTTQSNVEVDGQSFRSKPYTADFIKTTVENPRSVWWLLLFKNVALKVSGIAIEKATPKAVLFFDWTALAKQRV